jgi:hypothetical protein
VDLHHQGILREVILLIIIKDIRLLVRVVLVGIIMDIEVRMDDPEL